MSERILLRLSRFRRGVSGFEQYPSHRSGIVIDTSGNLYGTTEAGGAYKSGTVFRLQPQADGTRKERVLHTFNPNTMDGVTPIGGLALGSSAAPTKAGPYSS